MGKYKTEVCELSEIIIRPIMNWRDLVRELWEISEFINILRVYIKCVCVCVLFNMYI